MPLYATSRIDYSFGGQTFGANTLCSVYTSVGGKPSMVHSDAVSKCEISAS
jgi:hypothetical protein